MDRLIDAGRVPEAAEAASRLRALFDRRPDDSSLAGLGAMVLDAALWLLAGARDADALALCETLVGRLHHGSEPERADAAWHAQVAAATATVLWRLGSAELALGLRALEREIAEAG